VRPSVGAAVSAAQCGRDARTHKVCTLCGRDARTHNQPDARPPTPAPTIVSPGKPFLTH